MKKIAILLLLLCAGILLFSACADGGEDDGYETRTDTSGDGSPENLSGVNAKAVNLSENFTPRDNMDAVSAVSPSNASKAADFAVRLFRAENRTGSNTLVSPLSVFSALAMTANGARGETLSQIESALGMTLDECNAFFRSYANALPSGETYKLNLANSIWFASDRGFSIRSDFLQTNADYYGADAFKAPFDSSTLRDINGWVQEKTDGMIPEILNEIPDEAVVYLINALAFEAEWISPYMEYQVREGSFTPEDGTQEKADFMYSTEYAYLENENATGFLKYYKGGKYAFAALLPKEGTSLDACVASLDGGRLLDLLSAPQYTTVETAIPKFETSFDTELSSTLKTMGMPSAFDPSSADFTGLGESKNGKIFIGRVLHKTFISVAEKGTKAGAATVVEMLAGSAYNPEIKTVILDRPFIYMLIDTETKIPFFIGTMTNPAD